MVGGLEYFPRRAPADLSFICSAAGQESSDHVPVVFIVRSRGLHKIRLPIQSGSGTGQIPSHPLGSGEERYSSVVRNPRTPFGPPSSQAPTPCNPLPPMALPCKATKGRVTHTQSGQEICRKFNYSSCTVPSPTSAGSRVASVTTPASPALELLQLQGKLHP